MNHRIEHDLLGEREVPMNAYYGVHTLRALENFPISGIPISTYPSLMKALACVKQACAQANLELDLLDADRAHAIIQACQEVRAGSLHDHFVVDVIQPGGCRFPSRHRRTSRNYIRIHFGPGTYLNAGSGLSGRMLWRASAN